MSVRALLTLLGVVTLIAGSASSASALQRDRGARRGGTVEGQSIDTSFRMERGGLLDLEIVSGQIIVTGTTSGQVRIRATADDGHVVLRASSTLTTLRVEPDRYHGTAVRYEISVPPGVRVSMEALSANLSARGIDADVDASTVSGTVELHDIGGLATIEAVSGNVTTSGLRGGVHIEATSSVVTVANSDGEVIVENTSGEVTLSDIRSKLVRVESVSGDVRFQGAIEPTGRYTFESHSGTILLALPPTASAQLMLSTYSGSIHSQFPITLEPRSRSSEKRLEFRLGNGEGRVSAETFSGSISITRGTGRDRQE